MSEQLAQWQGDFGEAYTSRNDVPWQSRVAALDILLPRGIESVLEVGCNRGHNIRAIRAARPAIYAVGIEPASYARKLARRAFLPVTDGDVYAIPYEDDSFDLAFTCGVLEHVPPDQLDVALRELLRVSSRYLLSIEYHAEQDTEVQYRGMDSMLWKRDYGAHWQRVFPELRLLSVSDELPDFDRGRAWLLEKQRTPPERLGG